MSPVQPHAFPPVPSVDDIDLALARIAHSGDPIPASAAALLEPGAEVLSALQRRSSENTRTAYAGLRALNTPLLSCGRANVVYPRSLGNHGQATRVAQSLHALSERPILLVTTDDPFSTLWADGPADGIQLVCPYSAGAQRGRFGSLQLSYITPEVPDGWQAFGDRRRPWGWVKDSVIVLAFHPYLAEGRRRFTVANPAVREAVVAEALRLAEPLLTSEATVDEAQLSEWEAALADADMCLQMLRGSSGQYSAEIRELRVAHDSAQERIADLERQLADAHAAAEQTQAGLAEADALEMAGGVRGLASITHLRDQVAAIAGLPSVAAVGLLPNRLRIITHPLVFNCGDQGLRGAGPFIFEFDLSEARDPVFVDAGGHPMVRNGRVDWAEMSVPLALAIGGADYRAAVALIAGALARPLQDGSGARLPAAAGAVGWRADLGQ